MISKEYLSSLKVMPVIVVQDVSDAVPIANALKSGGINSVEITLRTPAAMDALRAIKNECEGIQIGAGTVVGTAQLHELKKIGVDFAVSPGITEDLVKSAQDMGVDLLPGVASPSEVLLGLALGLHCFKLFPASVVGGIGLLKAMVSPFPQVTFCPTGGLTVENFTDYLSLPNVACVGGSWLVSQEEVTRKNWDEITRIARDTVNQAP